MRKTSAEATDKMVMERVKENNALVDKKLDDLKADLDGITMERNKKLLEYKSNYGRLKVNQALIIS